MIKTIRIQNFKSLRDVTVDLEPLTVLIGRSGTGKSNFVEALRFTRDFVSPQQRQFITPQRYQYIPCATGKGDTAVQILSSPGLSGRIRLWPAFFGHVISEHHILRLSI